MSTLCWTVCKTLLNSQSPPQQKKLLAFLPASGRAALQKAPLQKNLVLTFSPDEVLDTIHPSWLARILQPYTEIEKVFFLSALHSSLADQVKKLLHLQSTLPTLTPLGKKYLRHQILDLIKKERGEAIPQAALPEGPLDILLTFDPYHLSLLSFSLGLYDLAEELRFVIDRETMHDVETALTPTEWQTVKNLQSHKERVTFGRMKITKAMKSPQQLRLLIEQYGINRLAKALYGQHDSMLWHLLLHLGPERAEYFSKLCKPLAKPGLNEILQRQILSLIPQLTKASKKRAS